MEGVMEIDTTFAAASASQQSTPGTATSQSPATTTATGDPEWLLPVVTSAGPPTEADFRLLLSRVS